MLERGNNRGFFALADAANIVETNPPVSAKGRPRDCRGRERGGSSERLRESNDFSNRPMALLLMKPARGERELSEIQEPRPASADQNDIPTRPSKSSRAG
jgi:hypothetical protein